MFLWTPVSQTSTANWLSRLIWMEILSTLCRESIMKKLRAVFLKNDIKVSRVMSASGQISPYHVYPSRYVFYERQSVKPARLKGCAGSFERKYCLHCAGKVLWKNYEPFFRNTPPTKSLWTLAPTRNPRQASYWKADISRTKHRRLLKFWSILYHMVL